MSAASYRVSKADMEASRLVFVMLRGAKPMRKVAIPILDEGMSFQTFESQVRIPHALHPSKQLCDMPTRLLGSSASDRL